MKQVLIVEDDMILSLLFAKVVKRFGYEVMGKVTTGESAIKAVKERKPDLIIIDISLDGELDGIETMKRITAFSGPSFIYITGNSDPGIKARAMETNPISILAKPVGLDELKDAISMALA
ncbi:MAG: response regulator [Balneolales bacterium]